MIIFETYGCTEPEETNFLAPTMFIFEGKLEAIKTQRRFSKPTKKDSLYFRDVGVWHVKHK